MSNERRKGDGEDRISLLPEDVLCHILSFLPSEDAIATCSLSTRWKFLWRDVPALDFECMKETRDEKVDKFLRLRKTQRITRFRLKVLSYHNMHYFNKWLAAATKDGKVEHMNLLLWPATVIDTLFTCTTIVTLKLKVSVVPFVSVRLPSLKTMHLDVCSCPDYKNFLYGSPALELFCLKQIDSVIDELRIVRSPRHIRLFERRARVTVRFHLVIESDGDYDFIPDYLEGHLENVVKAKVYITCGARGSELMWRDKFMCADSYLNSHIFSALKQLRNVEFLSLADFRIKMNRVIDGPSTLDLPQFQNLVQLQLYLKDPHSVFVELPAECPKLLPVSETIIMDDSYGINKLCPYHDLSHNVYSQNLDF